jgi:hypothetical protein
VLYLYGPFPSVICSVGGLISYCVVCSVGELMSYCLVCVALYLYGSLPPVVLV